MAQQGPVWTRSGAFLGSVPASICDFVRVCVHVCVNNQFLVREMTTFNEWRH